VGRANDPRRHDDSAATVDAAAAICAAMKTGTAAAGNLDNVALRGWGDGGDRGGVGDTEAEHRTGHKRGRENRFHECLLSWRID
jgi:hypothetical protein